MHVCCPNKFYFFNVPKLERSLEFTITSSFNPHNAIKALEEFFSFIVRLSHGFLFHLISLTIMLLSECCLLYLSSFLDLF